jgi:hypothetical protein
MFKRLHYGIIVFCVAFLLASVSWADTLELKNGSVINGTFVGGTETRINFRVGSTIQKYDIADVVAVRFDSQQAGNQAANGEPWARPESDSGFATRPDRDSYNNRDAYNNNSGQPAYNNGQPTNEQPSYGAITVPVGTRLLVRTIDPIDSEKNRVGDRFSATLEEALYLDNTLVAPRGAEVYGRLAEARQAGHFAGRSELKLELTGIVVNGQTVAISTGDYDVSGKSRGANTAKKVGGGAVIGTVIGAIAGGGKGAAIGAGAGAGAGTIAQVVTHGEKVRVPSETLLEFSIDQPVSMPITQR